MCGRYLFDDDPKKLFSRYNIELTPQYEQLKLTPSYNISPGFLVPIITKNSPNKLEIMKWGLIPSWSKDPKIGYKLINARGETIDKKPSFKDSFNNKRCLIPATGFYEWEKRENEKIPHLIKLRSYKIFSFAGIYDMWKDAENKEFKTFSIITTSANDLVAPIHNRMPVILKREDEEKWLDQSSTPKSLLKLLKPLDENEMEEYTVTKNVNDPRNQEREVINKANY